MCTLKTSGREESSDAGGTEEGKHGVGKALK